jgi:predicted RNA-binding protein
VTGAFQAGDEVEALDVVAHHLAGDGVRIRYLFQIIGDGGFIAGRVGAIDLYEIDQVLARSIWKGPVVVGHPDGRDQEQGAKTPH